jgi:hypothetical protein
MGLCTESPDETFDGFWRRGPASRILGEYVLAHIKSISVKKEEREKFEPHRTSFESPWSSIVAASILYMQVVLNALEPIDKRMHKYTITLFHHDMAPYLYESQTSNNSGFLLWLLLLGLVGCHTYPKGEKDKTPHPSSLFFQTAVRRQAKEMGIGSWSEATRVLAKVVWPSAGDRSGFIKDLWDEAVSAGSTG